MLERFGGRRFWLTMVSGAGTWVLCLLENITGEVYAAVTIATVAAYITGNTIQKQAQIKADSSCEDEQK